MFLKKPELAEMKPIFLAAAPEVLDLGSPDPTRTGRGFNSGVMVMNVPAFRATWPHLIKELEAHAFYEFSAAKARYDQRWRNTVFKTNWLSLPPVLN